MRRRSWFRNEGTRHERQTAASVIDTEGVRDDLLLVRRLLLTLLIVDVGHLGVLVVVFLVVLLRALSLAADLLVLLLALGVAGLGLFERLARVRLLPRFDIFVVLRLGDL